MKCILTKANDGYEERHKTDRVVQSVSQSTESQTSATKVRFAAEIKPKLQSSDSTGSHVALVMFSGNTVDNDPTNTKNILQDSNNILLQSYKVTEAMLERVHLACRARVRAARCRRRLIYRNFIRRQSHSNIFHSGQYKGVRYRSSRKGRGRDHFQCNAPGARYRRKQNFKLLTDLKRDLITYELTARSYWADG